MGLRYRKSINLGGGVRINLSKSGVGYSFGGKGYRVTKTAKGTTRRTASIPGTGISYVSETGKKKNTKNGSSQGGNNTPVNNPQTYDTVVFENAAVSQIHSEGLDELLALANNTMKKWRITAVVFFASLIIGTTCPPLLLLTLIILISPDACFVLIVRIEYYLQNSTTLLPKDLIYLSSMITIKTNFLQNKCS